MVVSFFLQLEYVYYRTYTLLDYPRVIKTERFSSTAEDKGSGDTEKPHEKQQSEPFLKFGRRV